MYKEYILYINFHYTCNAYNAHGCWLLLGIEYVSYHLDNKPWVEEHALYFRRVLQKMWTMGIKIVFESLLFKAQNLNTCTEKKYILNLIWNYFLKNWLWLALKCRDWPKIKIISMVRQSENIFILLWFFFHEKIFKKVVGVHNKCTSLILIFKMYRKIKWRNLLKVLHLFHNYSKNG